MKSTELLKILAADGWYVARQNGSHKVMRHDTKRTVSGRPLTVPDHGSKDMPEGTWKAILKEAGLESVYKKPPK